MIIGDRITLFTINHAYMVKPVIFITYQYICEWVCVFFLGVNLLEFYHIIFHMISQKKLYLNETVFLLI